MFRQFLTLFIGSLTLVMISCQQQNATQENAIPTLKIAYVNTDSVVAQYDYLKQQSEIIGKQEKEASATLEKKIVAFQKKVQSLQRRAQGGNMTPKAIETEQRVLAREEQKLAAEQQELAQKFQQEGLRIQSELANELEKFVKEIQAEGGYDYIMSYGTGSNVLAVNPNYDVTAQIVTKLNASKPVTSTTEN